jgi:hypothetical protein
MLYLNNEIMYFKTNFNREKMSQRIDDLKFGAVIAATHFNGKN